MYRGGGAFGCKFISTCSFQNVVFGKIHSRPDPACFEIMLFYFRVCLLCRNLPIGGVTLLIASLFVRPKTAHEPHRNAPVVDRLRQIDWLGTILFLGAFTCLFLALQWGGQTKAWKSADVIGLIVGFGLLLGLFCLTQNYTGENSLLPRRILFQRTVLFGTIYLVFFGLAMAVVRSPQTKRNHERHINLLST